MGTKEPVQFLLQHPDDFHWQDKDSRLEDLQAEQNRGYQLQSSCKR
jgi:hypothetical protein